MYKRIKHIDEEYTIEVNTDQLRKIADCLDRYGYYSIAINLRIDASELDKGIIPGSEKSWRNIGFIII